MSKSVTPSRSNDMFNPDTNAGSAGLYVRAMGRSYMNASEGTVGG